jgi:hypothetical protein
MMDKCTVTSRHMLSGVGISTFSLGCEHRDLAVVSVTWGDRVVWVSLLLENKTVRWRLDKFGHHISEEELF